MFPEDLFPRWGDIIFILLLFIMKIVSVLSLSSDKPSSCDKETEGGFLRNCGDYIASKQIWMQKHF